MAAPRLAPDASGLRHLRWAREILGTLEAHYEHDPRLAQPQRDLLLEEAVKLRAEVSALSAAVKSYRDFLERERTRARGMLRVGRYLVTSAPNDDDRADAEAIAGGFEEAFAAMEKREREPRRQAVRAAVADLRTALDEMDKRLAARLSAALVDSLYPALTADGSRVADDGDRDDDAAA
jgi:hypothetical protein